MQHVERSCWWSRGGIQGTCRSFFCGRQAVDWSDRVLGWHAPPAIFLCDLQFYFLAAGGLISRSSTTGGDTKKRHMIDPRTPYTDPSRQWRLTQENSSQPTHMASHHRDPSILSSNLPDLASGLFLLYCVLRLVKNTDQRPTLKLAMELGPGLTHL